MSIKTKDGCPYENLPAKCIFYSLHLMPGDFYEIADRKVNYLLFLIEGEIQIKSTLFDKTIIHKDEVVFIPRTHIGSCKATEDTTLLIHQFDNSPCQPEFCIIKIFHHRKKEREENTSHSFILSVSPVIRAFTDAVMHYLNEDKKQTLSVAVWHLKHKELIQLFRYSYHETELYYFFHSMTGYDLPFKNKVTKYYPFAHNANELARLCGYGQSTFQRLFQKEFKKTVYQWMIEQKAKHILYQIQKEQTSFKEIANGFNFPSPAHFCRFCIKYLGDTPSNLRKSTMNRRSHGDN